MKHSFLLAWCVDLYPMWTACLAMCLEAALCTSMGLGLVCHVNGLPCSVSWSSLMHQHGAWTCTPCQWLALLCVLKQSYAPAWGLDLYPMSMACLAMCLEAALCTSMGLGLVCHVNGLPCYVSWSSLMHQHGAWTCTPCEWLALLCVLKQPYAPAWGLDLYAMWMACLALCLEAALCTSMGLGLVCHVNGLPCYVSWSSLMHQHGAWTCTPCQWLAMLCVLKQPYPPAWDMDLYATWIASCSCVMFWNSFIIQVFPVFTTNPEDKQFLLVFDTDLYATWVDCHAVSWSSEVVLSTSKAFLICTPCERLAELCLEAVLSTSMELLICTPCERLAELCLEAVLSTSMELLICTPCERLTELCLEAVLSTSMGLLICTPCEWLAEMCLEAALSTIMGLLLYTPWEWLAMLCLEAALSPSMGYGFVCHVKGFVQLCRVL